MIFQHVLFDRGVNTAKFTSQFRWNRPGILLTSAIVRIFVYHKFLKLTVQVAVCPELRFTFHIAFGQFIRDSRSHDLFHDIFCRRDVYVLLIRAKAWLLRGINDVPSCMFSMDSGGELLRGGGVVATGC